ncbi:MAG: KpsF/GutQ family sugar-phosphate isomerase [Alteraurantiacibacter sp.]
MNDLAATSGVRRDMDDDAILDAARRVIAVEIDGMRALQDSLSTDLAAAVRAIAALEGRVICTGIGKSGHVARKIAATLSSTGTPAYFVHGAEASHGDLGMITTDDAIIALSRSGETRELGDLVAYSRRHGVTLIAMTAVAESSLGSAADLRLLVPDMAEACTETRAPTTSTTTMMALGDALAVALLEMRGFRADDFKLYHPGGKLGASLVTAGELMHTGDAMPLAPESASLTDAIAEISHKGMGCVGITDSEGRLAGILTDGDVRRLLTRGERPDGVAEAMGRNPFAVAPDTLCAALLRDLNERKISQLFVLEDSRPVGIIHLHDLLRIGVS